MEEEESNIYPYYYMMLEILVLVDTTTFTSDRIRLEWHHTFEMTYYSSAIQYLSSVSEHAGGVSNALTPHTIDCTHCFDAMYVWRLPVPNVSAPTTSTTVTRNSKKLTIASKCKCRGCICVSHGHHVRWKSLTPRPPPTNHHLSSTKIYLLLKCLS